MLVVSESCQNYQNDAVSNSLRGIYLCLSVTVFPYPSVEGGVGKCDGDDSEFVLISDRE
jgi:hypothetical protein